MAFAYRSAKKTKGRASAKGFDVLWSAARWLVALFGSLYLTWALILPRSSGHWGLALHDLLFTFLGQSAFLLLPVAFYGVAIYFKLQKRSGYLTWAVGSLLSLASASTLLAAAGGLAGRPEWGGTTGNALYPPLTDAVGSPGAAFVALAGFLLGLQALFEISWREAAARLARYAAEDYRDWMRARREFKEQVRAAAERLAPRAPETARVAPITRPFSPAAAADGAGAGDAGPPQAANAASAAAAGMRRPRPADAQAPERAGGVPRPKARGGGGAADSPSAFSLPPLEVLNPPGGSAPGPSEGEIREAADNLDRTLASFKLEASVTNVVPGPVITRYEVTPAPGVTVNSIVARADDIALALKARGLRMIAPIPGKAAIGIEIANQEPAGVTLRQVLESGTPASRRGPLAFALGLSSDGTPVAADLGALPHLLIAGATNSGKSVMVHSLIQSMLFRARPEEVKFLLIDPKRIELNLYDGIPHLYDPKTSCENVAVITNSKEAARSLKALILVMEDRYEKFKAYKVRDIAAFNQEARKLGRPAEFYIVVVIDELADLMVVAQEVVEDSIQRLAQMARAVGIHLVLATQRPSVDVITGVIKANLPARIALRVASKVDSKVILDGNGAEALLGRGDMLYMAPGQDAVRIQGAFVSTEEIGRVVDFLRRQGRPDYPSLASMAAVGEEDLSKFGVEPIEFKQALELVLERRRVSQDLLKSQFGSSARATNLLSLLEVKKFIHKPEGTNRWEINFDQIEEHLKTRSPEGKGRPGS